MRKLTILFTLLTLGVGLAQAECVFTYTATEKLESQFNGLGFLESHDFDENTKTGTLTFIDDVTEVSMQPFQNCTTLQSITLPTCVTTIGSNAFQNCTALKSINLSGITNIKSDAFNGCSVLQSVDLSSVTTIEERAFQNCSTLQSISLPASVTSIGIGAFQNCTSLTEVTVAWTETDKIPTINASIFSEIAKMIGPSGATLHVPFGTKALYGAKEGWIDFGTIDDPATALEKPKTAAIAAIDEAIKGLTLFPKEQEYIVQQKEYIKIGETVEAVNSTKNATLAYIALHNDKLAAVEAVRHDMGDYAESEAIYKFIGGQAIEEATNVDKVTEAKDAAIAKLEEVSVVLGDAATAGYNKGKEDAKTELLGSMGDECTDCTVVEVTDGTTTVTLYNATSVDYEVKK